MIERLRGGDAYMPGLSLLAAIGEEAVGHVLLTKAEIGSGQRVATTLALAPLSVVPEHQGVGKRLVTAAHEGAAALGFASVLLVCMPPYYRRFGYQRLDRCSIRLPFDAPDENCMILGLRPGALENLCGDVRYADGWLQH